MTGKNEESLDKAVLQDAQTISAEIELEKLVEKVMAIASANTGAQKGAFIIRKKNQLQVVCQMDRADSLQGTYSPIPLEVCQLIPRSVIHYVRETKRILILRSAAENDRFKSDPYIVKSQPASLLCMPVLKNSALIGVLYLESSRRTGAFAPRHGKYLEMLSPHVSISLENALRYDDLKQELAEREQSENALRKAFNLIKNLKEQLQAENTYLQEKIKVVHNYEHIVGQSSALKRVLSKIEQVAGTDTTVLISGETGTGKELLAHAIHNLSRRKERALVTVNCAALPSTIIESELFGHEKGAFTGASAPRTGRFEVADGGSIFLDEVGELAPELQAKLLRVLQEGQFERLGSSETVTVDVRVIAATNRELSDEVRKGTFREDLFYRLNVFPIHVPPLRERPEDISDLVWSFIHEFEGKLGKKIDRVSRKNMEALRSYPWPGNVRELRNVIERAMILATGNALVVEVPKMVESDAARVKTLEELERSYITKILESTSWRVRGKNGAAELLGLKPTTLDSKMLKLGIPRKNSKT